MLTNNTNIVDSSAWLEYLAGNPQAKHFTRAIEDLENLLVPTIILYEVFKKILSLKGEKKALQIIAHLLQGEVIDINQEISLSAAKISHNEKLPLADSIILATARQHHATIWTQDSDFEGFPEVRYFSKNKRYLNNIA